MLNMRSPVIDRYHCYTQLYKYFYIKKDFSLYYKSKYYNNNQYGFHEKHSTINVITALTSDVMKAPKNEDSVLSVFVDFNNAFDKTDHQVLLYINWPFME